MTLFEHRRKELLTRTAPLSTRMRPRTLDEIAGQEHLIGPGRALRGAIDGDRIPSMILWGPPGSGKTTIARVIAEQTRSYFETLSAVSSGVADIRKVIELARDRLGSEGARTILFVDEIHRFNRGQQDALLPHVESGTVTLIGATTENPSFEVVGPLLSRCRVFTLKPLEDDHINRLVDRALGDTERGLGTTGAGIAADARALLVRIANGDARVALDALEFAVAATEVNGDAKPEVSLATVEDALQRQARYDRSGDLHYDTISAFIKSIRASDPDGALYWLARMVDAGEDPVFIARRLVISAAEDVGLAEPGALAIAVACQQGVHLTGWPEARILLAHTTVYLAAAPKSNASYAALGRAMSDVTQTRNDPVPLHLRNPTTGLMKGLGYGEGYKYAHDFPGGFVPTDNLPENLAGHRYYFPTEIGREIAIRERLLKWWGEKYEGKPRGGQD